MESFTKKEMSLLYKMDTPAKVQDFLNKLKFNFEENNIETLSSPLFVIRKGSAHCMEGALLGAYILSLHGYKPVILHLQATKDDFDHVVTLFKENNLWGALSKTNHAVLRYREPVYKDIHELVLSYFHEYFTSNGKKTLRKYSEPFDLNTLKTDWISEDKDLWYLDKKLDKIKHYDIVPNNYLKKLRKADKIEIDAGKIVEFIPKKNK